MDKCKLFWIQLLITITLMTKSSWAYYITVDAHAEECFFDRVTTGTKLGLMFEVVEGGFLDIDVKISGPDNKIIHQEDRSTSGKYTFSAHMDGMYTYCFGNQMSTMTLKAVMFNMEIGDAPKPGEIGNAADGNVSHDKIEEMVKKLSTSLTFVKHEQEYMSVRDKIHRSISESTNSRVVLWAFFEAFILVVMTLGQVHYLKKFFEVRRIV